MTQVNKSLTIHSRISDYRVNLCENLDFLDHLAQIPEAALLIDRNVYNLYNDRINAAFGDRKIFLFDALEENKNLDSAAEIYTWLTENFTAKRNLNFISVGGGITQDVSGFVASTLYRGINWYFVPTTLLSQVDSCIGGKTSLNFGNKKNLLGTFFPPEELFIYPEFQRTLTDLDRFSGFGEIIKFCLMDGLEKGDITGIPARLKLIKDSEKYLNEAVYYSLNVKRSFMENDEFDRGRRNLLNYGHCFGHALEGASGYKVPHGIAVNIGIMFANIIAVMRGRIDSQLSDFIRDGICLPFVFQKQLPEYYCEDALLNNLKNDKKGWDFG